MQFIPYLLFDGRCREAFEFYAGVLDGQILSMTTHGETPAAAGVSADWQDKIINAHLKVGDQELMASDSPPQFNETMNGFYVSIQIDDEDRAERIFNAFADGGEVKMPFSPTFWAKKFGMVKDRYGTPWMINCGMVEQPA